MEIKCKNCGNTDDFITQINSYEVYTAYDGKFHYQSTEMGDDTFRLYCRECSEEYPADLIELG